MSKQIRFPGEFQFETSIFTIFSQQFDDKNRLAVLIGRRIENGQLRMNRYLGCQSFAGEQPDRLMQIRRLAGIAVRLGIDGALIFDNTLRHLLERFLDHNFIVVGKGDHRFGNGLQRLNAIHVDYQYRIIESGYFNHLDTTCFYFSRPCDGPRRVLFQLSHPRPSL